MNTAEFLRHVLPSKGHYFLALGVAGKSGYRHRAYSDVEALAAAAKRSSDAGVNAFFALANYAQPEYVDAKGEKHWRTGDNAVSARSFWIDVDCGEQYQGDQCLAAADLTRFVKEANLPAPNFVVNSGNGLHVYWATDRDIPKEEWRRSAKVLKAIAKRLNFAQDDTTRTADVASVLRPVGVNNDKSHKGLGVKEVKLLRGVGTPVNYPAFVRALVDAKVRLGVMVREERPSNDLNNDLCGGQEYPPSSAHTIAQHCAQVRLFRDFKGAGQNEPTWRACLGLIKHTVEGEALAHEWSSGHESYDADDCQSKLDNWKANPTSCNTFRDTNPVGCAGCPHKCNSPISLGYVAPEHVTSIVHEPKVEAPAPKPISIPVSSHDDEDERGARIEHLPELPSNIKQNFRFTTDNGLCYRAEDEEGVVTWSTLCTSLFLPTGYYCDREDGNKWKLRIAVRRRPFEWSIAEIDAKCVGQGGSVLMGELSSRAMLTARNNKMMEVYMKTWSEDLRSGHDEIAMHDHMGWQVDNSFVCGDVRYFSDGTKRNVVLTDALRKTVDRLRFDPEGDKDRYRELIDFAYDRVGHEAYQFTYLAGYASPLIALLEPAQVGIVFSAWSGKSGMGKSTVAKLAGGIWHDPTKIVDAGGTTPFALMLNAGLRRNLPLVVDELTQWPKEKSGEFMYRYSSGLAKEQGLSGGGLRDNAHLNWSNAVICTGNISQHENIKLYNAECGAQLARVFEYEFDLDHDKTMSAAEGRAVVDELMRMRGLSGHEFSQYLAVNREDIRTQLLSTYNKLMSSAKLSKDARFWVIGAASVWVAYLITRKLGLQSFAAEPLLKWIVDHLKAHDNSVKEATVDYLSLFSDAISVLHCGFIVTMDRGSRGTAAKLAAGWSMPRGTITGRAIIDEGLLALSSTALINWCRENRVDKSQMIAELRRVGWLIRSSKARLGTGTHLAQPMVRVYELDWARFSGRVRLAATDGVPVEPTLAEETA